MVTKLGLMFALLLFPQTDKTPFVGKGVGGGDGHLCNASLRIYPHAIDYQTEYNDCRKVPYGTIEQASGVHYVFRLKTSDKHCTSRIVVVDKGVDRGGWEITGYSSEANWRRKDSTDGVFCLLY